MLVIIIALDGYHLRHFSFRRVLRCPAGIDYGCKFISGLGRYLGLCDTLSLDVWYESDVRQVEFGLSQAALLWISKVRGYDCVCGWWSAKETRKYQLQSNETHPTHFSNLWLWHFINIFCSLLFITGATLDKWPSGFLRACRTKRTPLVCDIPYRIVNYDWVCCGSVECDCKSESVVDKHLGIRG